jgi:hypothetical protein
MEIISFQEVANLLFSTGLLALLGWLIKSTNDNTTAIKQFNESAKYIVDSNDEAHKRFEECAKEHDDRLNEHDVKLTEHDTILRGFQNGKEKT